mmetsp:Transcript_12617/g.36835  ORF Transcript_12617/g.36835 Transcript_12617/m.36835 type:complete len:239 (-) Transcript_12617:1162-1878(-)
MRLQVRPPELQRPLHGRVLGHGRWQDLVQARGGAAEARGRGLERALQVPRARRGERQLQGLAPARLQGPLEERGVLAAAQAPVRAHGRERAVGVRGARERVAPGQVPGGLDAHSPAGPQPAAGRQLRELHGVHDGARAVGAMDLMPGPVQQQRLDGPGRGPERCPGQAQEFRRACGVEIVNCELHFGPVALVAKAVEVAARGLPEQPVDATRVVLPELHPAAALVDLQPPVPLRRVQL